MSEPTKTRKPGIVVFLCGLGFSALVLQIVDWLNDNKINVMGWYSHGILPVGALMVGLGSGLGYMLASLWMNAKLSKAFIWGMVLAGVCDYIGAQYVTYTHLLEKFHTSENRYTFLMYIKDICEHMTFQRSGSTAPGDPLGAMGYVYKVLELVGFTFGYVLPSQGLLLKPYCRSCQLYLKKHQLTYMHSPARWAEIKKMKKAERLAALQNAVGQLGAQGQQVVSQIKDAPWAETRTTLSTLGSQLNKDAAARLDFNLTKCPKCDAHHLTLSLFNHTVDKKVANKVLLKLDKTAQPAAPVAEAPPAVAG